MSQERNTDDGGRRTASDNASDRRRVPALGELPLLRGSIDYAKNVVGNASVIGLKLIVVIGFILFAGLVSVALVWLATNTFGVISETLDFSVWESIFALAIFVFILIAALPEDESESGEESSSDDDAG